MKETVGVVVGTFGDPMWELRADNALATAIHQTREPDRIIHCHRDTLQQARNDGAHAAGTDWLIFLDADDELDRGYIRASLAGDGDIRQPSTLGIYGDGQEDDYPVLIPRVDLERSNYIVIGAMCRAEMFFKVGGFDAWPLMEDWALWRKMVRAGAVVGYVRDAIYRVGVNPNGRNTMSDEYQDVYRQIRAS